MTRDDFPHVVAAWPRNARETVQVTLDIFKGVAVVDVRSWYPAPGGELRPSRSGVTLGAHHLPMLADALARALAEAKARAMLTGRDDDGPR